LILPPSPTDLPAKSGNDENSIENETKESRTGWLVFSGGVNDSGMEAHVAGLARKAALTRKID